MGVSLKPKIESLCIVGLGLMGGSAAKDLRAAGYAQTIIGVDSSVENAQKALELGLVDEIQSLTNAVPRADLVLITIPVDKIPEVLIETLNLLPDGSVVTDMGSTKAKICEQTQSHPKYSRYVPSHPMAGTEESGPAAAIPHLFASKTAVICNVDEVDTDAFNLVKDLYETLFMRLTFMKAEDHDRHVAIVSHLPHVISFVLAQTVLNEEKSDRTIFNLASGGFESTARIGKSSSKMWSPIFLANRKNILNGIQSFSQYLSEFAGHIEGKDSPALHTTLARANEIRRVLKKMADSHSSKHLPEVEDESCKESLTHLRTQIDTIDSEIVRLLGLRQKMAFKIGCLKQEHGIETVQENRWRQVLDKVLKNAKKIGLNPSFIMKIYEDIHTESLKAQLEFKKESDT